MKNSKNLFQEVLTIIHLPEDREEIKSMAFILLEKFADISKTDILAGRPVAFPQETAQALQTAVKRINQGEPLQYVIGEEYFFGRRFHVNPSVLIPRPETEELVRIALAHMRTGQNVPLPKILDIGTGSGCIPVTLFLELKEADVYATDTSAAALSVALDNALQLKAKVTFLEHDILHEKMPVSDFEVIVSNPPYVTEREKIDMKPNVIEHEPHLALFVPDVDPLMFYKAIVQASRHALKGGGLLAVEINEKFGREVADLFVREGLTDVVIARDVSGKPRFVKGIKARI